jgi:hypothetical protein
MADKSKAVLVNLIGILSLSVVVAISHALGFSPEATIVGAGAFLILWGK